MRIYDVSVLIHNSMHAYPGDPPVEITPVSRIPEGAGANVSLLSMGSHTGTHVDPPYHFVNDGVTVDELPLDVLVGPCLVCDVGDAPVIGLGELEMAGIPSGVERILFKTRNSHLWAERGFRSDFTWLDPEAAGRLAEWGVRLVGIDYLSIDRFKSGAHATHRRLLEACIVVLEGLDLRGVPGGMYTLVCLPLKIAGGDGAPARAILISDTTL